MKKVFWILVGLMVSACETTKVVTVERVRTDTVLVTKHTRDSIWLHDSIRVSEKGDTVRIEKWHTKYIEREVHDTLYQSKTDSIPVPYEVIKEVPAKLSKTQKGLMWTGGLSILALVLAIGFKLRRLLPW